MNEHWGPPGLPKAATKKEQHRLLARGDRSDFLSERVKKRIKWTQSGLFRKLTWKVVQESIGFVKNPSFLQARVSSDPSSTIHKF